MATRATISSTASEQVTHSHSDGVQALPVDEKTHKASLGFFGWIKSVFVSILTAIGLKSRKVEPVVISTTTVARETENTDKVKVLVHNGSQPPVTKAESEIGSNTVIANMRSSSTSRNKQGGADATINKKGGTTDKKAQVKKRVSVQKLLAKMENEIEEGRLASSEEAVYAKFEKEIRKMSSSQKVKFERKVRIFIGKRHAQKIKGYKKDYYPTGFELKVMKRLGYKTSKKEEAKYIEFLDEYLEKKLDALIDKDAPTLRELQSIIEKDLAEARLGVYGVPKDEHAKISKLLKAANTYRKTLDTALIDYQKKVPGLPRIFDKLPTAKAYIQKSYNDYLQTLIDESVYTFCEEYEKQSQDLTTFLQEKSSDANLNALKRQAKKLPSYLQKHINFYSEYGKFVRREMIVSLLERDEHLHGGVCFAYSKRVSMAMQSMRGKIKIASIKADQILPEDRQVQAQHLVGKSDQSTRASQSMLRKNGFTKETRLAAFYSQHSQEGLQRRLKGANLEEHLKELTVNMFGKIIEDHDAIEKAGGVFDIGIIGNALGHQVTVVYDPKNNTYGYVDSQIGVVLRRFDNEKDGLAWVSTLFYDTLSTYWSSALLLDVTVRS